jgi:hypothetical protein
VVGRSERVIRRLDPSHPLRFTGLHCDGQLKAMSEAGLRSQRELTLWSPLQDCTDDTISRLLVMHRGDTYGSVMTAQDLREIEGATYLPVQLRPYQVRNEQKWLAGSLPEDIETMYDRVFAGTRCYAPYVRFGSSVLFDCNIWHGSYFRRTMTRARYSLDFRTVGQYTRNEKNAMYSGELFDSAGPAHEFRLSTTGPIEWRSGAQVWDT